ncbi:NAD(P)/FAD-dependent oxidoreductase [Azospirillum sp. B4]|uniref:FAD-dependent oxidoreductase n=1 Tax=Azospirillum sp. B4 TaxID=95605 RepID=UPI00034AEF69|nr:NAD(P)/FAD-dependent oxidoreductase [Azospirillum sp. B4]
MKKTKVIVAGAGPVGTVAAYYLARAGIEVVLLEAGVDCAMDLRASTLHPPTLEMLDTLGITPTLLERGLKAPVYQFRDRGSGDVYAFDMSELADITRYPFRVQCEQYHLSRLLASKLEAEPNAAVYFNHRLVHFEQDDDGVTVTAETPVSLERFRADYLIGADGASSLVRKWLGIEFDGFTYPEKFLCLTTETPLEQYIDGLCHVNYVSDAKEWLVLLRVPSLWRILVPAGDASDETLVSDEKKNAVFGGLIGLTDEVKTHHRTIYRVHQRVAKTFRVNRVMIIGDAAHLNNPIGGFGMNSGIHDAFNLCAKLVEAYRNGAEGGGGAEALLARFDRQRRTVTHDFTQAQTIKNMEFMKEGQAAGHRKRHAEMQRMTEDPVARRQYLITQSMFGSLRQEAEIQ